MHSNNYITLENFKIQSTYGERNYWKGANRPKNSGFKIGKFLRSGKYYQLKGETDWRDERRKDGKEKHYIKSWKIPKHVQNDIPIQYLMIW